MVPARKIPLGNHAEPDEVRARNAHPQHLVVFDGLPGPSRDEIDEGEYVAIVSQHGPVREQIGCAEALDYDGLLNIDAMHGCHGFLPGCAPHGTFAGDATGGNGILRRLFYQIVQTLQTLGVSLPRRIVVPANHRWWA
jgi:hypothetical protein